MGDDEFCNPNLLRFGEGKFRDDYIEIECPGQVSGTQCYRKACNCDLEINDVTEQPVSYQPVNTWQCIPPDDPILTGNTMFLSPSPMNYTFGQTGDTIDTKTELDQLELSFSNSFGGQPTTISLNGKSLTLKPKNIEIIGIEKASSNDKKARIITRFAQRSMMAPFMMYSPRNNSDSENKRALYIGAKYEFEGIGSNVKSYVSMKLPKFSLI